MNSPSALPVQLRDFDQDEVDQEERAERDDPQREADGADSEEETDRQVLTQSILSAEQDEICVFGAPAAKTPRKSTKSALAPASRKSSTYPKKAPAQRPVDRRRMNSGNNNDEENVARRQWECEVERLREDAARWKRELEHVQEEKAEIEEAFRRLDREIACGYNLAERKEKELKIAELITKNQKMSQLLEKELRTQSELRVSNAQLLKENQSQAEQLILLNSATTTLETKHAALGEAHATMKSSLEAAQLTIERQQEDVNDMHMKLINSGNQQQRFTEYEHKIQSWERKYLDLERKFTNRNHQAQVQTLEIESLLENKAGLEKELACAHDQVIRLNALMKTMEAKLEASLENERNRNTVDKLLGRIRELECELLQKNRAFDDIRVEFDEALSGSVTRHKRPNRSSRVGVGRPTTSTLTSMTSTNPSRVKAMASRVAALTEKLRHAEELRERKARGLDVLMQAFPYLLQQLDALQDKYVAATESNEILKSALEQMQQSALGENEINTSLNVDHFLRLARENYLLAAPYQLDLLAGFTGAAAFTDHPVTVQSGAMTSNPKRFPPFRVAMVTKRDSEDGNSLASSLLTIVADASDVNGVSYLSRSKINTFLEFIQGSAAKAKFKEIIIARLAELMSKLREVKTQFASETTAQRATIQMLQREVDDLKWKLKNTASTEEGLKATTSSTAATSSIQNVSLALSRRKLLMKLIDLYTEKQQQRQHRQSTFLTQSAASDVLISSALTVEPCEHDSLDLSDCGIDDDDLRELLWKTQAGGVSFHEIHLNPVALTDNGAQLLASFLEECPSSVKVLNLEGDAQGITYHGVEAIKRGLLRNFAVHRIEANSSGQVIDALAAQDEFEIHGRPTVVLRVFLPSTRYCGDGRHATRASDEEVAQLVDRVNRMGLSDLSVRSKAFTPVTFSIYSASAKSATKAKRAGVVSGTGGGGRSLSTTLQAKSARQHSSRGQQSEKQRRLEMAIERATASTTSTAASVGHSQSASVRVGLARPRSSNDRHFLSRTGAGVSASLPLSFPSSRLALRSRFAKEFDSSPSMYGNAHLATVRGLKR